MKQRIKILMLLCCVAVFVVIALNGLSSWKTRIGGAFVRNYPPHFLVAGRAIDLEVNSYYFAGASGDTIFLGNYTNPRIVLQVGVEKMDTTRLILDFPTQRPASTAARVTVQDSVVVVTDGPQGLIFRGDRSGHQLEVADTLGPYAFNHALVVGEQKISLRSYDGDQRQNILSLYNGLTRSVAPRPGLLTKQVDGVFCTEGSLVATPDASALVYVYLFRNEFVLLDSNMVLRYRGHTIDTNYTAKIKIQTMDGGSRTQIAAPPVVVNRLAAASDHHLITVSEVLADNDPAGVLADYGIADVYDLTTGRYQASFYISKQHHQHLSGIWVYRGILYVMVDHYLYSYHLPVSV